MKTISFDISDDEYQTLVAIAHPAGTTATEVARSAVRQRIREFGGRTLTAQVSELHGERLAVWQIAADLGMTNAAVRDVLHSLGLRSNRNPRPADPKPVSPRARSNR